MRRSTALSLPLEVVLPDAIYCQFHRRDLKINIKNLNDLILTEPLEPVKWLDFY
jgi:hypothetical protein